MIREYIEFSSDDPHGNFKKDDAGTLLGFVSGGDNTPCGVVKHDGIYEAVPLSFLRPMRYARAWPKDDIIPDVF